MIILLVKVILFKSRELYIKCPQNKYQDLDQYVTVCPRSLDPLYIVTYYIKWVKTSWTYRNNSKYFQET